MDAVHSPTKFPETGLNELNDFTAQQWPGAVRFLADRIQTGREQSNANVDASEKITLTDQQDFVVRHLALPAITDTLGEMIGRESATGLISETFVRYLADRGFDEAHASPIKAAGFYSWDKNLLTIREVPARADSPEGLAYFTKVFVHEYFHFLSHQHAQLHGKHVSISRLGAMTVGTDIREAHEETRTWDYFKSFNEAVNETLTIQTLKKIVHDTTFKGPDGKSVGFYQSYADYRGLLEKTMADAIIYGATTLPKAELWQSIGQAYLTGNYRPTIRVIRATYPGITLKEFGLMTSVDDLPQEADFEWGPPGDGGPGGRRLSSAYRERLRARLNGKTERDYRHDTPLPPPPPPATSKMVLRNNITAHQRQKMRVAQLRQLAEGSYIDAHGRLVQNDEHGLVIQRDEYWLVRLLPVLTRVATAYRQGSMSVEQAELAVDVVLFEQHHISELSSGFAEFYVLKHRLLDANLSDESFTAGIEQASQKIQLVQSR